MILKNISFGFITYVVYLHTKKRKKKRKKANISERDIYTFRDSVITTLMLLFWFMNKNIYHLSEKKTNKKHTNPLIFGSIQNPGTI